MEKTNMKAYYLQNGECSSYLKNYRVHIYAVVRVPVDVEADSPVKAVKEAELLVDLDTLLNKGNVYEFAGEIIDYLVDELDGDGNLKRSYTLNEKDVYEE